MTCGVCRWRQRRPVPSSFHQAIAVGLLRAVDLGGRDLPPLPQTVDHLAGERWPMRCAERFLVENGGNLAVYLLQAVQLGNAPPLYCPRVVVQSGDGPLRIPARIASLITQLFSNDPFTGLVRMTFAAS